MTACRSCGATHPYGTRLCPRTREPVEQGPCGSRIDRYDIERLLGAGGFGGVYVAMHTNLEAFLVMELLAGRDLDAMLRSAPGPQPESRSVAIMLEVLAGLSAAHRAGVVHRDLKPANVFLAQDGGRELAKIVDFGISHARLRPEDRTLTAAGMILGTPAYMAPEQIQGRPVDERVDIYAAGVVLYQMLSGGLPHDAETFERLVVLVCTEEPRPVRDVAPRLPPALAQVVDRAIAREPAARFATADAFADALRAATRLPTGAITSPLGAARADHFAPTEMMLTPVSVRPATQLPTYMPTATHQQTDARSYERAPTGLAPARASASIALPALILGGLVAAGIAVVLVSAVALVMMRRSAQPSGAASVTALPSPPLLAAPSAPVLVPAPSAGTPPAAAPPSPVAEAPAPSARSSDEGGVHWREARAIGGIDTAAARGVLRRITAECEDCRLRGRAAHVSAQLMFGAGEIRIAQADPNEPNDEEASRCVANRFREAAHGVHIADSGILIVSAELDPR